MQPRARFIGTSFTLAAAAFAMPRRTFAGGPRPGPYCLPLARGATDRRYDFELVTLDDDADFTLSAYLGHAVWLSFFATWCGPCNREAAGISQMAERYAAQGMRVFGIDVSESAERARAFRKRHGITFPILLDSEGSVFRDFGLHTFPTHVFFDAAGELTCVSQGALEPRQMDNEIAVALAHATPGPASAGAANRSE